jgi:hypothetical protein
VLRGPLSRVDTPHEPGRLPETVAGIGYASWQRRAGVRHQMNKQHVEVFLGDPIEDRYELHVLNRLRGDLARRGVRARILANFIVGPGQRQVDLLVVTDTRAAHVEVKNLDPALPLVAKANGPWRQRLPDGRERAFDHSFYRQAHQTTYALSDEMHRLARTGAVPAIDGKFYRHIDTVVCLHPEIPASSELEPYNHVDVVGYPELVDRLAAPGPRPPWSWDDWDATAREIGVYPEPTDTPAERALQARLEQVADYRRRFAALHETGLHELSPVAAAVDGSRVPSPLAAVIDAAAAQRVVTVTGASETGKTHSAKHAAVAFARDGGTPLWVRCREFEPGRFVTLLAKAAAACTTVPALQLVKAAADAGVPVVVFLDGLNECPDEHRGELLEQLAALRLRLPVGIVITSTGTVDVPDTIGVTRVQLALPDHDERNALLASYGAPGLNAADSLSTPLELALAAECAADLPPEATRTDVLDAYIRRRCPGETVREALRRIAEDMDERIRLALPTTEAVAAARGRTPTSPETVDDTLRCPLLSVGQGRVAFAHESLGRFLAAEQLTVTHPDITDLAETLRLPHRADLRETAVGLQTDGDRRHDLLLALAKPRLLADAARGHLGTGTATRVKRSITTLLAQARDVAPAAVFHEPAEHEAMYGGHWESTPARTDTEQAMLIAAALCLADGVFIPEVAALLDATDARCAREMRRLREDGYRTAISAVVHSTYTQAATRVDSRDTLAASVVLRTCEFLGVRWRGSQSHGAHHAVATRMLTATMTAPRWGRLMAALHLIHPDTTTDLQALPDLLQAAWDENGYHLRVQALMTVTDVARTLDDITRQRMLDVLRSFEVRDNIMLSSALVDALAAYGDIEPVASLDDIRADIAAVLADPDNPLAAEAAERIIGLQFDNDSVFGPYWDAVAELRDEQRVALCMLALRQDKTPFHVDWMVAQLADHAEPLSGDELAVLQRHAADVDLDVPMAHEPMSAHVQALRAWARISAQPPEPPSTDGDLMKHAWRLVDTLLFALFRGQVTPAQQADRVWEELLDLCPAQAALALYHLQSGDVLRAHLNEPTAFGQLLAAHPDRVRQVLEWALANRDNFGNGFETRVSPDWRDRFVVNTLGQVGTRDTTELLREYLTDPDLGQAAVEAIRDIERREQSRQ